MVRRHLEGIVAWQTRQTNGFLEALNGLFQAAKRRARGFTSFDTIRTVIFLIAGKLDFASVNPHAGNPLKIQESLKICPRSPDVSLSTTQVRRAPRSPCLVTTEAGALAVVSTTSPSTFPATYAASHKCPRG